jgi:hypothetical protein
MNISKTRKPLITQVDTKFVVSITLERKPLLLSVEHWKSLKGFNDHIKIDKIAPAEPSNMTMLTLDGKFKKLSTSI